MQNDSSAKISITDRSNIDWIIILSDLMDRL